jgi:hypothetical protein
MVDKMVMIPPERKCCFNNNNNICAGGPLEGEGISFFQKNISYQHNMIAQVLVNHIKLFYGKVVIG